MLLYFPAGREGRENDLKRFALGFAMARSNSGELRLLESDRAGAAAPRANWHGQSPGNAAHLGVPEGFTFAKAKKQKKKKKKQLFIEGFLATEGVEILQILQKSEDVLYWSGDHS